MFFYNLTKKSAPVDALILLFVFPRAARSYAEAVSRAYTTENASKPGQCRLKRNFNRRAELTSRAAM